MFTMNTEAAREKIIGHCAAKPDAYEDHPWGETVFKVGPKGKIFCFCGVETASITVKSTLEEQAALIQHPHIETVPYVGRYGWVRVQLADEDTLELALDLIDKSYEAIAPKKKRRP